MALDALAVLAWEAVARHGSVDLVAHGSELAVSVLVELADGGHSDFLSFKLSEIVRTFWSFYTFD